MLNGMLLWKNYVKAILRLIICICPVFTLLLSVNTEAQGLQFKSNDSLLTQRTSLHIFNKNVPEFSDKINIDFDLAIWERNYLGYIFNLAGTDNSYSLTYLFYNNIASINFNVDSKSNKIKIVLPSAWLRKQLWLKVKIDLDLAHDKATISINDLKATASNLGFTRTMAANIVFGKNPFYTEVPNMAIKNLYIGNNENSYSFPLNEWKGTDVHDKAGNITGYVENPIWLINESYFWKPFYTHSFSNVAGLNFNTNTQNLFIFSKDSLITINPQNNQIQYTAYKNKMPVKMVLGKSIFNAKEKMCYVYELYGVSKDSPTVAGLNLTENNLSWKVTGKAKWPNQLHHHNTFYDANGKDFYLFGGYGVFNYYNDFLKYNQKTDNWEKMNFSGDIISPRFFSATGPSNNPDEILLFGGYGNESGNQVIGGRQYYDLYRINTATHIVKKAWTIKPHNKDIFVPANNLILSPDKKYFYALCYPHEIAKTALKLYRFCIADGSYQVMSAPLAVTSERIESDINLFFDADTKEFFCTVQEFTDENNSTIKIYSLQSPPVSNTSYLASLQPAKKEDNNSRFIVVLAGLLLTTVLVVFFAVKKKQKSAVPAYPQTKKTEYLTKSTLIKTPAEKALISPLTEKKEHIKINVANHEPLPVALPKIEKNAVYVLGGFEVYDRHGKDISHLFSRKIRQLFILVLLNSENGQGISSKKLSQYLWPEKDPVKTKNIKGVTINHLRNNLGDLDDIEMVFQNDVYTFSLGENFYCDYYAIAEAFRKTPSIDFTRRNLIAILRGTLLSGVEEPWMDDFKFAYEEQLTAFIIPQLQVFADNHEFKTVYDLSKLILSIDPFNEEALKFEVTSLKKLKGVDYARKAYDQYSDEYKRSLGVSFETSFEDIIR